VLERSAAHAVSAVVELLPWNTTDVRSRLDQRLAAWPPAPRLPPDLTVKIKMRTAKAKKSSKRKAQTPAARLQYGALTYRKTKTGGIEILLVTSRQTKRWIIPKGWPIKGLRPYDSAAQEAYEEAGVHGTVGRRPVGRYVYHKLLDEPAKVVPCEVEVYSLLVRHQDQTWPESRQRLTRWYQPDEALAIVNERDLGAVIKAFVATQTR
jgi:8-oxo-dGTP pyrophosphatase MutT (NUDIX family)